NMFSGNLLPMTSNDLLFPKTWRIYSVVISLIDLFYISAIISGFILVLKYESIENTVQDGVTISLVVTIEVFVLLMRMHISRDLVIRLIQKLNDILHFEDETMKYIVHSTLDPLKIPLQFYCIGGESIASGCIFIKKVALDVYMINLILLTTAQYRYIAIKLAKIFRND
ncbi:hypothetical protein EAG_00447, partial [Camponotus floridanus]